MTPTHLTMSVDNQFRLVQFSCVKEGHVRPTDAAATLGIGDRQFRRAYKTWQEKGNASLIHGLCGKPSNNTPDAAFKKAVIAAYREKYKGFGPSFAAEKLAKIDGLVISPSALRLWLAQTGEWNIGQRIAPPPHRSRRERKPRFGQMVQMDGSPHDWFSGRNPLLPMLNLMVMVDDATSIVHARLSPTEDAHAVYSVFREWAVKYGLPESLYVDKAGIYIVNEAPSVEQEVNGKTPETQFARSMRELAVNIIHAHSPQAKGRVERMNQTLQDRLVKELTLVGISDIDAANKFIAEIFLPEFNAKFQIAAAESTDAHRTVAQGLPQGKSLDDVLAFEELRVVAQDWCVRWDNRIFQITEKSRFLRLPTRQIIVRKKLDGKIEIVHGKAPIAMVEVFCRPKKPPQTLAERLAHHKPPTKPARDHRWRQDAA